jgi:hypothetical protein
LGGGRASVLLASTCWPGVGELYTGGGAELSILDCEISSLEGTGMQGLLGMTANFIKRGPSRLFVMYDHRHVIAGDLK